MKPDSILEILYNIDSNLLSMDNKVLFRLKKDGNEIEVLVDSLVSHANRCNFSIRGTDKEGHATTVSLIKDGSLLIDSLFISCNDGKDVILGLKIDGVPVDLKAGMDINLSDRSLFALVPFDESRFRVLISDEAFIAANIKFLNKLKKERYPKDKSASSANNSEDVALNEEAEKSDDQGKLVQCVTYELSNVNTDFDLVKSNLDIISTEKDMNNALRDFRKLQTHLRFQIRYLVYCYEYTGSVVWESSDAPLPRSKKKVFRESIDYGLCKIKRVAWTDKI